MAKKPPRPTDAQIDAFMADDELVEALQRNRATLTQPGFLATLTKLARTPHATYADLIDHAAAVSRGEDVTTAQ